MRKLIALLFLISLASLTVLAQNPAKAADPPKAEQENSEPKAGSISEETEKIIGKLREKLVKLEERFKNDKADLEEKIARETKEESKKKFRDKLAEKQAKFDEEKKRILEQIDLFQKIQLEKQSQGKTTIQVGGCVDVLSFGGDTSRVIETNGPPQDCRYFPGGRFTLNIMNPSAALQSSGCWDPLLRAYTFDGPAMVIFGYFPVGSAAKVYVFIDMRAIVEAAGNSSTDQRDRVLLDICPPLQPQRQHSEMGSWHQVNFSGNWGDSYDSVLQNIFGAVGGGGHYRGGFEGQTAIATSQRVDPLALQSIVLDANLPKLLKDEGAAWSKIADAVWKTLGELKEYSALRKLDERLVLVLRKDNAREALLALAAEMDKPENVSAGAAFKNYSEKLKEAAAAPDEKKAKKIAKNLLKEIAKSEKAFDKKIDPIRGPFRRVEDFRRQREFVAAGEAMGAFIKTQAQTGEIERLKADLDGYKAVARSLQEYVEKLKSKLVLEMKQDEFFEQTTVEFGAGLLSAIALRGSTYDYQTQRPKLKAIVGERSKPANPNGAVDKEAGFIEERRVGLLKIDDLIAGGFDKAVIQSKDGVSVVHIVKGNDMGMVLLHFVENEDVTTEEVSLTDLRDKRHALWLPFVIRDKRLAESMVPADPAKFLETFNFIDKENHRLTVILMPFDTVQYLSLKKEDGSLVRVKYYLYPGVYEERIKVVDSLESNPKKREIQLPPILFRVLTPPQ